MTRDPHDLSKQDSLGDHRALVLVPSNVVDASSWAVPLAEVLELGIYCQAHHSAHMGWGRGSVTVCPKCKEEVLASRSSARWVELNELLDPAIRKWSAYWGQILDELEEDSPAARHYWLRDVLVTLCAVLKREPEEVLQYILSHPDEVTRYFSTHSLPESVGRTSLEGLP